MAVGDHEVTPEKKAKFVDMLAAGLSVSAAAKAAGFAREHAYRMRKKDLAFAAMWDDALETGTDKLEDIALKRAADGSDTMLIFLLKARRPDKFRDFAKVDLTNSDGTLSLFAKAMQSLEQPGAPTPDKVLQ